MKPAVLVVLLLLAVSALGLEADRARTTRRTKAAERLRRAEFESGLNTLKKAARAGLLNYQVSYAAVTELLAKFENYEHEFGSSQLTYDLGVEKPELVSTDDRVLESLDGVKFAYKELTAMSGDYFGPKDSTDAIICNDPKRGRTSATQEKRFLTAFDDIWHNPKYGKDARKTPLALPGKKNFPGTFGEVVEQVRAHFLDEKRGIEALPPGPQRGSTYYNQAGSFKEYVQDLVNHYTPKLEGKARSEGFWRALAYNDDHFGACGQEAYRFGLTKAMSVAFSAGTRARTVLAGLTNPIARQTEVATIRKMLVLAYAYSGFVSHFLSDAFSAGHVRTPRVELRDVCVSALKQAPSAGISANVQHDEDNQNCLLVKNILGDLWWSCGDRQFFDDVNANNRLQLHRGIKAGLDSVRQAFDAGRNNLPNPTLSPGFLPAPLALVPRINLLNQREMLENTCAYNKVFVSSDGKRVLFQRVGLNVANGMPRSPYAQKGNFGASRQLTASNEIFPRALIPLPALSPLPAGIPAADLECKYTKFQPEHCCTTPLRATPQKSVETFTGATRVTWVNTCKLSQLVVGAVNKLTAKAADMQVDAANQSGVKAAATKVGAAVVEATAATLDAGHKVTTKVIKPAVTRVVTTGNKVVNKIKNAFD